MVKTNILKKGCVMKRKQLIVAGVLLVLIAGLAFGRGERDTAVEVDVPPEFAGANIDWRQFEGESIDVMFGRHPWEETITPLIPQFEALTGIRVNLRRVPHDVMMVEVPAAMAAGTLTDDVMMARYYDAGRHTLEGWTAEISGFLNDPSLTDPNWYNFNDFFPGARQITDWGAYQDRLPITAEASVLIYRKDIYQELGIQVPTTFDELLDAARRISESGKAFGITARGGPANWMPFYGMVRSHGGEWVDENDVIKINTPGSVAAVETLVELARYAPPGITAYGWDQINTAMMNGSAAQFIDASVIYPRLQDPERSTVVGKIGAAPYPIGPGGRVSNAHFWSIAMNARTQKPGPSWLFMQWATSPPVQKQVAIKGILPPRASIWDDPEFAAAYSPDFIDAMNVTMETAVSLPPGGERAGVEFISLLDTLTRALQEAIEGEKTPQQAMDDLARVWADIIR
ncbi:MAG: sugar ABC transporter substrate-binding protein [Spirochaetaceae bacterium]|nr:MAG: sugar ABC transporter substrate-binding protein [Spirochaetaceae bacterium]